MRRTRNAAPAAASKNGIYTHDKNTPFRQKIKLSYPLTQRKVIFIDWMKQGERFTACDINRIVGFNDARKFISDLRRHLREYVVRDIRLETGCKLYWLDLRQAEPTLF